MLMQSLDYKIFKQNYGIVSISPSYGLIQILQYYKTRSREKELSREKKTSSKSLTKSF